MKKQDLQLKKNKILRQKAEEQLNKRQSKLSSLSSRNDIWKLTHELQVHQIELEIQNEELCLANERAIIDAEKYIALYDFAPTGYITLSKEGKIIGLNLKGAILLGRERKRLINRELSLYISNDTKPVFNLFLNKVFEGKKDESCEVSLTVQEKDVQTEVFLVGNIIKNIEECQLVIFDITERKQTELSIRLAKEEAEENEEKFRQLFENSPIGKSMTGIDGSLNVNKQFSQIVGYSEEELRGKAWTEITYPEDIPHTNEIIKSLLNGEIEKASFEKRYIHKNGNIVWTDISTYLQRDIENKPQFFITTAIDTTERKKSEEKLIRSEHELKRAQEITHIGSWYLDLETNEVTWTEELFKMYGFDPALPVPPYSEHMKLFTPASWKLLSAALAKTTETGVAYELELQTVKKDGSNGWMWVRGESRMDPDGNIVGLWGAAQDISDHKRAEEKLRDSENLLKEAQHIANLGIYTLDIASGIWLSSEILDRIFGIEADYDRSIGGWESIIHPEWQKIMTDYFAQEVLGNKNKFHAEYKIIRKNDGAERWVVGIGNLKFNENGQPISMIGTIQDITERKDVVRELTLAKEKAEESDRLKSAFLTNMSHEIRTPMNGILGFTELLKEPNLSSDDQQDFIQTIQVSGGRMLNTINNIVNISKIESGLAKVDIEATDINEKMIFTYKFFKPEIEKKGLQFSYKNGLKKKDAIIMTDNEKIYGILTNLIKNAIKFTFDGSIEFGYRKKESYLEFYVKDTGIGISESKMDHIFERFRQGSESHNRGYEGSGLGLSIAKSYLEMLDGKIWVESKEGLGSTFYFTIPYISESFIETEIENTASSDLEEVQLKNMKILIVEDDEVSHSLLTRNVQKISKEILHAISGIEAVELYKNNHDLDLVLMDIRMPQMDGLEATRQIRMFSKDLVIIAQTAYGFESDCKKALEAGCNDFITKPIDRNLLFELIKKHCKK